MTEWRGLHIGQVTDLHPEQYQISVLFKHLAALEGVRVNLGGAWQGRNEGEFRMPQKKQWVLVAFYGRDPSNNLCLSSVPDFGNNLIPTELLKADPEAVLEHYPSDESIIHHGNGSLEHEWADGSRLHITTVKDETPSNPSKRAARTPRKATRSAAQGEAIERKTYAPPAKPPADVVFIHKSGAEVRISADGKFDLKTPMGHKLTMSDDKERGRDNQGNITDAGVSATRPDSGIYLETEKGLKFTLFDDPTGTNRYARLETPEGRKIELRDGDNKTVITDPVLVEIHAPDVRAGDGSTSYPVARADKVAQQFSSFQSTFNAHTHSVPAGILGTFAALPTTSPATTTTTSDVESTKLKVKE